MSEGISEVRIKKRAVIRSQARNIIRNVIQVCEEEKRNNMVAGLLTKSIVRASIYTGVPTRTIRNIKRESNLAGESPLKSPTRKGKKMNFKRNMNVDGFDREVIRRCINEFYLTKNIVPTSPKLITAIREKISFPWGVRSLRKLLKDMGYKWRKCNTRQRILIERPNNVFLRTEYLRTIRQYRNEGRELFYVNESWVDNNLTFKKCWLETSTGGTLDTSSSNHLILVHAASRNGLVNNASLIFKAGSTTGEYHGEMNSANYEKWVTTKLLPNLPQNSVVIIDNAPYHGVEHDKVPTKNSLKKVMIEWLESHHVLHDPTSRKDELYKLIDLNKPRDKMYHVDELIKAAGHSVLRLPPNMCELNPTELAWRKVKQIIQSQNVTTDSTLTCLQSMTTEAISLVKTSDWIEYENHVVDIEYEYWETDGCLENILDDLIVMLGGESSVSDSDKSDTSESDNENSDSDSE